MRYQYEAINRFFEANRRIAEFEHRPGVTVTFISEVDLSEVEAIRLATKLGESKPSYTAFVVKALALTMREFPYANRRVCRRRWWLPLSRKCLQAFNACDVAVAVERDLPSIEYMTFADILREADRKSLQEINAWLRELATSDISNNRQWREFYTVIERMPVWLSTVLIRLPVFLPNWWVKYRGAAAMVSSPAKYGVDSIATSWTSPLGISFGYVRARAVVKGGQVVPCPTFNLVMNFDRRVMLGAQAALFFSQL